ncbi:hypothetical protein [Amycolatopsis antarctica]|uniref:hypothetical protein n=1 Tax=Amycolatopsis antarctica TaxID=1854586 RepID=UPI001054835D|nr:hypothetical protein [Amycolatopsis antarctica]
MIAGEEPSFDGIVLRATRFFRLPLTVPLALVLAGVVGGLVLEHGAYIAVFVAGVVLAPLAIALNAVAGTMRGHLLADAAEERYLREHGERAVAVVERLTPTNSSFNDAHVTDLVVTVVPAHGRAYRTTTRHAIHPVLAPAFQPGKGLVVRQSAKYPGVVRVEQDPPRQWREQAAHPPETGTVSTVHSGQGPRTPAARRRPPANFGVVLLTTVVLAVGALLPIHSAVVALVSDPDLFAAEELRGGLDEVVAEGGTAYIDVVLWSEKFTADAGDTEIVYRPGRVSTDESYGATDEADRFDLREVNLTAIPGLIEQAARTFGVPATEDVYVRIERSAAGPVEMRFGLRTQPDSRTFTAAADGTPALNADALTEDGARAVLALLVERMGGSRVYQLTVGSGRVSVDAPTSPGSATGDTFAWADGKLVEQSPMTIQPDEGDRLFDLAEFDPAVLPRMLALLEERSELTVPVSGASFRVEHDSGRLGLRTSLQDDYSRVTLTAAADGSDPMVQTGRR